MDAITSFGEWLRRARKARDLTQAELAHLAGCAEGTICNLEADALRPSKQLAMRLAAQLGLDADAQAALIAFARGAAPSPAPPSLPALPSADEHGVPPSGAVTFLFTEGRLRARDRAGRGEPRAAPRAWRQAGHRDGAQ